jgi:hypothetical protein
VARDRRWVGGILLAGLVLVALLVVLDLQVGAERYILTDLLFRDAASAGGALVQSHFHDPSPFSIAVPADRFVHGCLRHGELPLWDPYQGCGYSPVARGYPGALFPLRWLMVLVPANQATSAFMVLVLALAVAGGFLYGRVLELGRGASLFLGCAYATSSVLLTLLAFNATAVLMFLPWLLWAERRWRLGPTCERFAWLALLVALTTMSGHQMCVFVVLLGVVLVHLTELLWGPRRWRRTAGAALAGLTGLALAGVALLPSLLHLAGAWVYKTRTAMGHYRACGTLAEWGRGLRAMLWPTDTGGMLDDPRFYLHLGIPMVALALVGLATALRRRGHRFLVPLTVVTFVLCLPGPWMAWLEQLPPLGWVRNLYLLVLLVAAVVVAAALAVDWIVALLPGRWLRAVVVVVILGVPLTTGLRAWHVYHPRPARPLPVAGPTAFLLQDRSHHRISALWGQLHLPNLASWTGIEDLRIISPTINPRYHEWCLLADPRVLEHSYPTSRIPADLTSPLLGTANVRYLLEGKLPHRMFLTQLEPGDPFGRWPPREASPSPPVVYEDALVRIRRVEDAHFRPRAYLAEQVTLVPDLPAALAWIRQRPEALLATAVLEADPTAVALESPPPPGRILGLSRPSLRTLAVEVEAEGPRLLVVAELHEAGWRATVDGQEVPIHPVNVMFRGVVVPAGRHQVEMRYVTPGLVAGLVLTLVTALALLWAGWWCRRRSS